MRRPRPKTLFLPVVGLLAAVLVLLTVVAATTYLHLKRGRAQALTALDVQSTAIISGLTAGLRTGWRFWVWQPESLQSLVEEMSTGDVAFISLLDAKGRVLAHTDESRIGSPEEKYGRYIDRLDDREPHRWFVSEQLYVSGRMIRREEIQMPRGGPGAMMGPMGRGRLGPEQNTVIPEAVRPAAILVGLTTRNYREAQTREMNRALLMGGILFVLGSGAIYFIFVIQNYRTVDRTLQNLTTYTGRIVDHMPNGLITLDSRGAPVMINGAARAMFGWPDRSVSHLADAPAIRRLSATFLPRLAAHRPVLEEEFDMPLDGGESIPLAVSAASVPGQNGDAETGALFILRDLRQIRSLEEQVRQGEKLAAVGQLAAGVAHEIRNPLSSMRGLARFLARDMEAGSREAEYLRVMVEEIDRLNRVITSLLDFARPRKPEIAPVDINEVCRHTLGLIEDDARGQGIDLIRELAPENPDILADRDQAVQAVLNLLLNAVEAMPEGGRLSVRTRVDGQMGLVRVEDTGPGFPAADRSRLVDPFFTTKKKGAGLGLAQVATIMENHGGRLELGGQAGSGAVATLHFPLAAASEPEES